MYVILPKNKFKLLKLWTGLCRRRKSSASPDLGLQVHTVYSVRTTNHFQKKETVYCAVINTFNVQFQDAVASSLRPEVLLERDTEPPESDFKYSTSPLI